MKKMNLIFLSCTVFINALHANAKLELTKIYEHYCRESSDIFQHIPVLKDLSKQCESAIEIGIRDMVSTWGILQGLTENSSSRRSYLGIDLVYPPEKNLTLAKRLSAANGIQFDFWAANDMTIDIPESDLLFIDSLHTYCHLTYELETFCHKIKKYIAMHDTSEPWGTEDDDHYFGDYSEYPAHYDRTKKGLWAAVEDFLAKHPEWILHERRFNCHGFTILRRVN